MADLSFNITAKDHASPAVGKVAAALAKMDRDHRSVNKTMQSGHAGVTRMRTLLAGLAGSYAAVKVAQFGKESVIAFAEAEQSQIKLQAAYKRFPKLADVSLRSLRDLNSQMQAKTKYDDDDLALMQSRLAAFDLTGKQLQRLTPLVADYASATGKDVVSAGDALGKAIMGNGRALKSLGIDYEYTGNRAKDLANITELVSKKTHGLAVREARSASGQLAILTNQYGELKETLGAGLVPGLRQVNKALIGAMPGIKSGMESAMPGIRSAFRGLGKDAVHAATGMAQAFARNWPEIKSMLSGVGDAAGRTFGVLKTLWGAFKSLPPGVQDAALQLGAIATALGLIKKTGLGSGISLGIDVGKSIFGAIKGMNVNAGVVNVNGKVGGLPGGGGGGGGGGGAGNGRLGTGSVLGGLGSTLGIIGAGVAIPALVAKIGNDLADMFPQLTRNARGIQGGVTGGSTDNPGPGRFGRSNTPGAGSDTPWSKNAVAAREYADSVGAASRATEVYGKALGRSNTIASRTRAGIEGNSKAAIRNKMALFGQAIGAQQVVAAQKRMGRSSEDVSATQRNLGRQFVKSARDMGVPRGEARKLAAAYGLLPPKKTTKVDAPGADKSKKDIDAHNKSANGVPKKKDTKVDAPGAAQSKSLIDRVTSAAQNMEGTYTASIQQSGADGVISATQAVSNALSSLDGQIATVWTSYRSTGTPPKQQAAGGHITGPGTETSDSIPAMLSHNEFVVKASSARSIGYDRLHYINQTGLMPRFAGGGLVRIGDKTLGADDDRDYTAAERAEINRAIAAGDAERNRDIRRRDKRNGESNTHYNRRIRRMDEFRERLSAAREAKAAAQARVDRRKEKAREKAAADDQRLKDRLEKSTSTYGQYHDEVTAGVRSGLDRMTGFATVTGFDLSAASQAQEALAQARSAVNSAGSPQERATALKAVQEAQTKVNETAVNGKNVTEWMAKKLAKIRDFKGALSALKRRGLNSTTLAEVAQMDPDSGTQIAKALQGSDLSKINNLQSQILTEGGQIGKISHNASMEADAAASKVVANVVQGGGLKTTVNVNSKLFIDGRDLYQSLLRVERSTGKQLFVSTGRRN